MGVISIHPLCNFGLLYFTAGGNNLEFDISNVWLFFRKFLSRSSWIKSRMPLSYQSSGHALRLWLIPLDLEEGQALCCCNFFQS